MAKKKFYDRKGSRVIRFTLLFFILNMLVFSSIFASVEKAKAASVMVSMKSSKQLVKKGESFYVIITLRGTDVIGGFAGAFAYDSRMVQYVTGGVISSGNDDEFTITDMDRESQSNVVKYSVKFFARKNGTTTMALKPSSVVYGSDGTESMSVSSNQLTVTIGKKASVSKKEHSEETVATPNPVVTPEEVSEATKEPAAKSEDGSTSKSSKKKELKKLEDTILKSRNTLSVSKTKKGIVMDLQESITIVPLQDKSLVPKGFKQMKQSVGGITMTTYVPKNGVTEDYFLIYGKRGNAQPVFYLYDRMKRMTVPYEDAKSWISDSSEQQTQQTGMSKFWMYGFFVLLLLGVISMLTRKTRKDREERF